jgi:ATP-dependent Clp protease, protease subunit
VSSYTIPNVIAQHPRGERIMDVYSHLLTERIVYLGTAVDPGVANTLIAQLIHLEWESTEQEINLYINCEGGDLPSMLALYDTMQYIQAPVATTCVGQAIAAGAVLLAAGAPGRRAMLPHARVVLHQPVDSGRGTIPDMILQADEIVRMRAEIESILSKHTGQSVQALRTDTDRDRVLTAQAALEYGIVDQILASRPLAGLRGLPGLRGQGLGASDALVLAQITGYLLRQLGEGHVERASEGGDHLAGRLLAPALDLGQVLRRYPGPGRRLRQSLALLTAQGPEAVAKDLTPQWLSRLGLPQPGLLRPGDRPQLVDLRVLRHVLSVRAQRGSRTEILL